eukprot:697519-Alexandrium_andersonii.AAC.1
MESKARARLGELKSRRFAPAAAQDLHDANCLTSAWRDTSTTLRAHPFDHVSQGSAGLAWPDMLVDLSPDFPGGTR